ncbi:ATP synthase subunit C [Anaerotruncus massiliensis (ex Togo et al. 2019)]|uniref:ATP synthase subunit C n=1 Tax=Anaerotruncus massiliensis (ex Togo et al. 2019) TaxID=1673720 RepID=UPI0023F8F892|nr:ATP synthase subunit C [Anaerotruncus massiliensis (ex Togo et al. 2019)]
MLFVIATAAVIVATLLLIPIVKVGSTSGARRRVLANAGVFLIATLLMIMMAVGVSAATPDPDTAPDTAAVETVPAQNNQGMGYLAAALATGLSCLGAGIAIASTAPAAIGAFSEDPKAFGKALIFVVLGEGVALYGLLISILLINKL